MTGNIYVVDDDDAERVWLHRLLSLQPNLTVRSFPSGDAFLLGFEAMESGVLLLDSHMPGSSGMDVLATLWNTAPKRFASVLLTGEGSVPGAVAAMKLGAFDVLEKPYDAAMLLHVIEAAFLWLAHDKSSAAHAEQARTKVEALSPREREVLMGLIDGRANKVIALDLDLSPRTVEIHRANLMTKLGARNLPEALRVAFAAGLIPQI